MDTITYEKITTNQNTNAMIHYIDAKLIQSNPTIAQLNYVPPHWHRSIEFSLVYKGEVCLWINNEKKVIHEREFIFVNSAQIHQLTSTSSDPNSCEVLLVIISYEYLKHVLPNIDDLCFDLDKESDKKQRIYEIYDFFYRHTHQPQVYDELLINAYLYELLYILMTEFQVVISKRNYFLAKKRQHRILEYIEQHYQEELTLTTLADVCHLNEEYFSRSFKKLFGINFKTYLTNYRLYRSLYDVVNSDITIQEIAIKYGFSNTKSLIGYFKERYGMTPFQYRQQHRNQL